MRKVTIITTTGKIHKFNNISPDYINFYEKVLRIVVIKEGQQHQYFYPYYNIEQIENLPE